MPTPKEKRNYRKEYLRDHAGPKEKKHRAWRNWARRALGLKKGDGNEGDHIRPLSRGGGKGKGNLRAVKRKTNRRKAASWAGRKGKMK